MPGRILVTAFLKRAPAQDTSWAGKIGAVLLGVGLGSLLRLLANQVAPGVSPYAFVYPASLVATLVGGWIAGTGALAVAGSLAWFIVVPVAVRSGGQMHYQVAAAVIAAFTGAIVIAAGEGFRAASRLVLAERNAKLEEREMLFQELQHRVGNDFMIVSSLLDLQRQRSNDPETRKALEQAMSRIRSIAQVHRYIYALPEGRLTDLRQYLRDICNGLTEATLPPAGIHLSCDCEAVLMERNKARAIGLLTNELITNAVKHAFPNGRDGHIEVRFCRTATGWRLTVADDGIGMPATKPKAGLGTGLIKQFVHQAGGTLTFGAEPGTKACLDLPASAASSEPANAGDTLG
jgi:two-component system, sensor histidine kinase PdtaS